MATSTTMARTSFWKRAHYLNRMTMPELVRAYFAHPTIIVYIALALVSAAVAALNWPGVLPALGAAAAAVIGYPVAWYGIHRYILHGRWMWKNPITAKMWWRTHYAHHQDPYHLEVLFGSPLSTLPAIAATIGLLGLALGGIGGFAIAFGTGCLVTLAYEFLHCIQHLGYTPKTPWVARIKRLHMEHHFHDEKGNYGIVSFFPDRWFGTQYARAERPAKSRTVFNLGYDEAEAERFPWVKRLSGGVAPSGPRRQHTEA